MKGLRIGFYQPLDVRLLRRHCPAILLLSCLCLPWLLFLPEGKMRAAGSLFAVLLILLAVLDSCYGFLYDRLLLPLGAAGFGLEVFGVLPHGVTEAVAAAAAAGGLFWGLRWLSRGGLGLGDVKFAAVLGLWLGLRGVAVAMALAVLMGGCLAVFLLLRGWKSGEALPFGPFLSLGAYAAYLFGDIIWQCYWEMIL